MAVDRVRPHFFEIVVGSDFVLDIFGPPSRPVWSPVFVRTSPRVSLSQGGSYSAYARRMRCEIYLTTSSLATCIRQSVYDSEVLSINHLRLWAICTHTLAEKHHRGEITADWVCGSGLRYLRKRTKVLSEAD